MRAGYIIVLTLAANFVLAGAAGFAMGPRWQVVVAGPVAAPPDKVIGYLADFQTWRQWSVWNTRKFPESEFSYRGDPGSTGAEQVWKFGPTTTVWHLLEVKPNELSYWRQSNDGPVFNGQFQAEDVAEGTHLTWTISGNTGFNPYDRLIAWFYSDRVRSQLRASLQGLQQHFDTAQRSP